MFAVRYSRCVLRTYECFHQTVIKSVKYSRLSVNVGRETSFRLPRTVLINKRSFCAISDGSSEEYKPDFEAITKGDPETEKKLKVLLLEIEVLRQEGKLVPSPSFMKQEDWVELVNLQSRVGRQRYLTFLFKKQKIRENEKLKRQQKREEWEQNKPVIEEPPEGAIGYGFRGSNIFLRFYDTTINSLYNNRLVQAMQFGQKLVVDCGFEQQMTKKECVNCAKQLMLLFADNRLHDDPYDVHFCNFAEGTLKEYLRRQIPTVEDPGFPMNLHQESYLDLFPKDQLVYLTPHCKDTMENYDDDAIYIIGAMVDKANQEPLSLAKAKKEQLRMAKFPLDKYLQWGSGSGKSLTLNQCIAILLDVKKTGDWKYALRHVPKRKLVDYAEYETSGGESVGLRYNKRIQKFRSMWKPSVGLSNLSYNRKKRIVSLLDSDDEEERTKPSVDLKNIMK